MKKKQTDNNKTKTTSEKPISLSPLNFKEALAALLKVKPKEEKESKKPSEKS